MNTKLYLVEWRDACGGTKEGWRPLEDLKQIREATILSCGAVIHMDEERLIVCPHIIPDADGNVVEGDAEIAIPMGWVMSITELGP